MARGRGSSIGVAGAFFGGVLVGIGIALGAQSERPGRQARELFPPEKERFGGWPGVIRASVRDFGQDRIPAAAAAVTFYVLLALFPAISAFVSLYGLMADVGDARRQVLALGGVLPSGAVRVISDEMTRLTQADHQALGLAFAISLAVSIWSANAGAKALIDGLNVAYEAREKRNFIHLNLISLALTVSAILLAIAGAAALAAAPRTLAQAGFAPPPAADWLRWPVMFNFGHYNRTYGSLGAIVGFLTWAWLSLMTLLFGAELNNEVEKLLRPAR